MPGRGREGKCSTQGPWGARGRHLPPAQAALNGRGNGTQARAGH